MDHANYGSSYSDSEILAALDNAKVDYRKMDDPAKEVARLIADGEVVAWFQGRMEWGPRALGNRSLLADPTRAEMRDIVNKWVKHREDFRPFAPSVIEEKAFFGILRAHHGQPVHAVHHTSQRGQEEGHPRSNARGWNGAAADRQQGNKSFLLAGHQGIREYYGRPRDLEYFVQHHGSTHCMHAASAVTAVSMARALMRSQSAVTCS